MAEEDEIDILGDFSFNSCFAQNNQGIPSCSDREDTVHPQWLLDSVTNNWYDNQTKNSARVNDGPSRKLTGNRSKHKHTRDIHTAWRPEEKELLIREMAKYGRNIRKIAQTLKTKTAAEIQALIEAEYGVRLDTPSFGLDKHEDHDDVPTVVQEEIVTDDMNILNLVTTGATTIKLAKKPFRKKSKNSLLKPDAVSNSKINLTIDSSEIFYEDEMVIGSTQSVGCEADSMDILSQKMAKQHKEKVKAMKKIGNHRRKVSKNHDGGRSNKIKEKIKSPQLGRQRKDSGLSDDSTKSPKMQIVLGSGQALPISEGEQVIKIEKKKDSDPESDIDVDVDSDGGEPALKTEKPASPSSIDKQVGDSPSKEPMPPRKLQPMPKRPKKMNLTGDGGLTIMHTAAGDLYEVGAEPRRARVVKPTVPLVQCREYDESHPAPLSVKMHVSCLVLALAHAHGSLAEVMGLVGGRARHAAATLTHYRRARAAADRTHCDMDPVSQAEAAESLRALGLSVTAWHHSHPAFPPAPSAQDLRTQRALQRLRPGPLALITSPLGPPHSHAQYSCIIVEGCEAEEPIGYRLPVELVGDVTADSLPALLAELSAARLSEHTDRHSVRLATDVCPHAGITYLEKLVWSITYHMRRAGSDEMITARLVEGVRDIFR